LGDSPVSALADRAGDERTPAEPRGGPHGCSIRPQCAI